MIKSGEHQFHQIFWAGRLSFRVEDEAFLLTQAGQSVMNVFTASSFNGNFAFRPVEHSRHEN